MSFGGASSAMIHSVKSNLALRRGRNHLFDRNVDLKTKQYVGEVTKASAQVREKFRRKLEEEKNHDRKLLGLSVVLGIVVTYLIYSYLLVKL